MAVWKTLILGLAALSAAHPGHEAEEHRRAVAARDTFVSAKRSLDACASQLESRGVFARGVERRKAEMAKQRMSRRIAVRDAYHQTNPVKRDTTSILLKDHEGTINGTLALSSDYDYVFNATGSTVLNPEGEVGPFFVNGEYIRSDIRDSEPGIDVVLEAQIVDIETCQVLSGVWLDIWSCNSTGVYSGVQNTANGNGADASNLNNTALRGIQQTDDDGVVKFTTKFPGHYSGRTTHLHAIVHQDATQLANGTLTGGTAPHIGQFFYDQKLITEVEATAPYNTNTQVLTENSADHVFGQQETANSTSDPVFNYVFFGDDVSEGIFSWIYIGVNTSAAYTPTYSFQLTDHGSEAVGNGGGFPGGPPA